MDGDTLGCLLPWIRRSEAVADVPSDPQLLIVMRPGSQKKRYSIILHRLVDRTVGTLSGTAA